MKKRDKLNAIINRNKHYLDDSKIEKIFSSEYNSRAIDFLFNTKTSCDIERVGSGFPSWQNKDMVDIYKVTLKNSKHTYCYDFYGSIKSHNEKISYVFDFYSVLACLDAYIDESFDDFCACYGYEFKNESEYIKAKKIHLDCLEQSKELRKLFSNSELSELADIN